VYNRIVAPLNTAMGSILEIDKRLAEQVATLARRKKKSRNAIIEEALRRYLEDSEDYVAAVRAYKKSRVRRSLEEVLKKHGLAG
jgi:predicted transcriptional regulator